MYVRQKQRGGYARWIICAFVVVAGGCGVSLAPKPESADNRQTTLDMTVIDADDEATYYEANPNDLFDLAEPVDITYEPRGIRGRISGPDDVDVFDLGPVIPGDHIVIDMDMAESLNGAIALFDATGTSLLINDHRNVYLGIKQPFVDVAIRHGSDACFVAVTATPGYDSKGDYALLASNVPMDIETAEVPPPRPDTVLLDFDGGKNVKVGSRAPVDVPEFDAARISPDFAGQTNRIISRVMEYVREDYEGLNLTILSTWEGDTFEPGMTRICFGTYDEALLGVAEGVDEFNAAREQVAIIFTDTFAAFMKLDPSVEEISQALANVTSHEIGHLLGLVHTNDPTGIMDVTASLSQMLVDQAFERSPIYKAVFPLGYQDAPNYLLDVLGGDPFLLSMKMRRGSWRRQGLVEGSEDTAIKPARAGLRFSTCSLEDD